MHGQKLPQDKPAAVNLMGRGNRFSVLGCAHILQLAKAPVKGSPIGIANCLPDHIDRGCGILQQRFGVEQPLGVDEIQNTDAKDFFEGTGEIGLVHLEFITDFGET